ncbi:MAG: hypothetical protein WCI27_06755 [Candidatus Omnitrophota bacterium]
MRKFVSFLILLAFCLECMAPPSGWAQGLLPSSGATAALSPAFTPAHLKGLVIDPKQPFKMDFLIHRGDEVLTDKGKQSLYPTLIKYFLAALAIPDIDQWVNLSPYEKDRIIPDNFGLTGMGRDLLAQDYILKQITASLTNPDTDLGKKFWDEVYSQAYQKFGTTDIPTDTFNKVWIMPDKAVLYEKGNTVYVLEHHLKVMMEKDYLATRMNHAGAVQVADNDMARLSQKVMAEVIIPAIEKEVNEGKNFAQLRQVYSGTLLAAWYKRALKGSILTQVYADRGKVNGINQDPSNNQKIYEQYVQAFKAGAFNMIKEDVDRFTHEVIPRKYFSGGVVTDGAIYDKIVDHAEELLPKDFADAGKVDVSSVVLKNSSTIEHVDGVQKVYVIGQGKIEYQGKYTIKGYRNQIKFLGDNQQDLKIIIGDGFFLQDGFISFRQASDQNFVSAQGNTTVFRSMHIGKNVKILKYAEIINVPKIGNNVIIDGGLVIEMDEGGVGDESKILGDSDLRMSSIGRNVTVEGQSKIFKAVIGDGVSISHSSIIGGKDELSSAWREDSSRVVITGSSKSMFNNVLVSNNVGGRNTIQVDGDVSIDGVSFVFNEVAPIIVKTGLAVQLDQRVYIHEGVVLDDLLTEKIKAALKTLHVVNVFKDGDNVVVSGEKQVMKRPVVQNVAERKVDNMVQWTKGISKVFSIDSIESAIQLNEQLENGPLFVSRVGALLTQAEGQDIVVTIHQGAFLYPGLEVYAREGRTVTLNLFEIGSRGGTIIIADESDVWLGPLNSLGGRIAGGAQIRDVVVSAEFNNFGGIANNVFGDTKITIRNQGILEHAYLRGQGEIIWGWYQGAYVNIIAEKGQVVGLSHGGIFRGGATETDQYFITLSSSVDQVGYQNLIGEKRQPLKAVYLDKEHHFKLLGLEWSKGVFAGIVQVPGDKIIKIKMLINRHSDNQELSVMAEYAKNFMSGAMRDEIAVGRILIHTVGKGLLSGEVNISYRAEELATAVYGLLRVYLLRNGFAGYEWQETITVREHGADTDGDNARMFGLLATFALKDADDNEAIPFAGSYQDVQYHMKVMPMADDDLVFNGFISSRVGDNNLNEARQLMNRARSFSIGEQTNKQTSVFNGGIDLAASNLDLQIKRDGAGVPLPFSAKDLDSIRIDGLVPVILSIRPAAGLALFALSPS